MRHSYLIALGSNRRHHRYGRPCDVVLVAINELKVLGQVSRRSPVIDSAPLGPAQRRFANAACVLESSIEPEALLDWLKQIERFFGRRRGQVWGDRVLDLDLILWSGGILNSPSLSIPHREFRKRRFVLDPCNMIAPEWRDPVSGYSIRQLAARAMKP
ncbi:MAG: 2-amino-4-hydroxy-6-hydroxymethyldihydropteridine diphosphokinase [Pseudomonadota bacterium]